MSLNSQITLNSVSVAIPGLKGQTVTVKYRLSSDPDVAASYTTVGSVIPISPSGVFNSPVVINGLSPSTTYTVWVINLCSKSSKLKDFTTAPIYSSQRTANFVKNNCQQGYAGSTVSFSQTYQSHDSQQAADALAAGDSTFNTQGQANANANGYCMAIQQYSAARTENFQRNNCGAGFNGSTVAFSRTYTSYVNQQDANDKAANDPNFETDGQQNANTYGTCASTASYTATRNEIFTKNDCDAVNYDGSSVAYPKTYTSGASQQAANDAAANDPNYSTEGQAYANANGTCIQKATIIVTLTEQGTPYTDGNAQLKDDYVEKGNLVNNGTINYKIKAGDPFTIEAYTQISSDGSNPQLILSAKINSGPASVSTTPAVPGASIVYPNTAQPGYLYEIDITTTANSQSSYSYTRTQDFQKNNCGSGYTGSYVTYNQTYTSTTSQQAAQDAAMNDSTFETSGQNQANSQGVCNAHLPSDAVGIIVIDMFSSNVEACAYLDTVGVTPYQVPAYKNGANFVPNDGTMPAQCWVLASDDVNNGTSLKLRWEINVARLINTYGNLLSFKVVVRGRNTTGAMIYASGSYSLKGANAGYMTMTGSPGSYIPSNSMTTSIGITPYDTKSVPAGGDGNIGLAYGDIILTLTYNNDPSSPNYKNVSLT